MAAFESIAGSLEEQVAQQRRIADALEVLAADKKLKRLVGRVAILGKQHDNYPTPERQKVLEEHQEVCDALSLQLTGLPSPWR